MRILVVHEVNYLSKIIYEFQILPEILSILGHEVIIVDYDDTWSRSKASGIFSISTQIYPDVHRAYPNASVTVRRPGMVRLPVISRVSGAVFSGYEIYRIAKSKRIDAILLYGLPTTGVQTILVARRFGIPVIFRAIDVTHELVPHAMLVPLTHIVASYVFNNVLFNVALTAHLKEYIQSYGVSSDHVRLLPSGVDTQLFSPGRRRNELLVQWGIHENDPIVLFMGTIYRFSGLDRVISDFPALVAEYPRVRLLIAGVGEDESRLKVLVEKKGLLGKVIFMGMQPYASLPDLVRASDVCINPFELNGITKDILPTKLFQYLACAKPVVATKLPGTLPFLAGEQQGVIYSRGDEMIASIRDILSDPQRSTRLGNNGHNAVQRYDWRQIANQLADWMKQAASGSIMPAGVS